MVVFEDGLARKCEYRRFVDPRRRTGSDDTAAMDEVLTRRFRRYLEEREERRARARPRPRARPTRRASGPTAGSTRRPAGRASSPTRPTSSSSTAGRRRSPRPQRALAELGIDDVALVGLAKRLEEVWLPGDDHPVVLPRTSEGLYLLQRVRDEAHRFAITFHRQRRSKAMTTSVLDGVPGLGETRRTALLRALRLAQAAAGRQRRGDRRGAGDRPGAGAGVVGALATQTPDAAVNLTTGEILDVTDARPTSERRRAVTDVTARPRTAAGRRHPSRRPAATRPSSLILTGMSGRRPSTTAQRARGPRLVRRRQPAAADARADGRPGRRPGAACPGWPPSSTSAAAASSRTCARR